MTGTIQGFSGCSKLATITVDPRNTRYDSRNNGIVETATDKLVFGGVGMTIPEGIKIIGQNALAGKGNRFVIPKSVVTIEYRAFAGSYINNVEFLTPSSLKTLGDQVFYDQRFPSNYVFEFPEGLETVGNNIFQAGPQTFQSGWIIYPSTIQSIGTGGLGPARKVVIKAVVPPVYNNATGPTELYVPDESVNDYKTSSYFSNLASVIRPLSEYID